MDRLTPVSGGFCLFLRGILKKSGKLGQYFDNYSVKGVRIFLGGNGRFINFFLQHCRFHLPDLSTAKLHTANS